MKYWKGKSGTKKAGQFGVMDDNSFVPDSILTFKYEYDIYVQSLPVKEKIKIDFSLLTVDEKIDILLEKIGLISE